MNNSRLASTVDHAVPPVSDKLWNTVEVADFLRVSIKTVFNLRKTGLPYLQLGGAVRFDSREVRDYLLKNRHLASHRLRQKARQHAKAS
jgi:phage terminase Nu1 subunit (DNA packaging protein)